MRKIHKLKNVVIPSHKINSQEHTITNYTTHSGQLVRPLSHVGHGLLASSSLPSFFNLISS